MGEEDMPFICKDTEENYRLLNGRYYNRPWYRPSKFELRIEGEFE